MIQTSLNNYRLQCWMDDNLSWLVFIDAMLRHFQQR